MSKSNKKSKINNIEPINKNKATVAAKILNMIENGRKEITTKEELETFPIGSLISYSNTQNIFKSCGFITKFGNDYFIYITSDFTTKYRVRYKNVQKMWAGDIYTVKKDIVSLHKPSSKRKTNFKVFIDNHLVFYAQDNFAIKRFINTLKYKKMVLWYDYFNHK